jgi:microcystin-dependent protein
MSEPFLGQITLYPYTFAPYGWMDCAGQTLSIQQYAALFSLIGTYYGGNGTSTFQLPNLQGAVAVGQGQLPGGGDYVIGETGGESNVTITQSTMPLHRHTANSDGGLGKTNAPLNAIPAQARKGTTDRGLFYSTSTPNTSLTAASVMPMGSNLPHNNIQPTLALRYCIAVSGQTIFPTRG